MFLKRILIVCYTLSLSLFAMGQSGDDSVLRDNHHGGIPQMLHPSDSNPTPSVSTFNLDYVVRMLSRKWVSSPVNQPEMRETKNKPTQAPVAPAIELIVTSDTSCIISLEIKDDIWTIEAMPIEMIRQCTLSDFSSKSVLDFINALGRVGFKEYAANLKQAAQRYDLSFSDEFSLVLNFTKQLFKSGPGSASGMDGERWLVAAAAIMYLNNYNIYLGSIDNDEFGIFQSDDVAMDNAVRQHILYKNKKLYVLKCYFTSLGESDKDGISVRLYDFNGTNMTSKADNQAIIHNEDDILLSVSDTTFMAYDYLEKCGTASIDDLYGEWLMTGFYSRGLWAEVNISNKDVLEDESPMVFSLAPNGNLTMKHLNSLTVEGMSMQYEQKGDILYIATGKDEKTVHKKITDPAIGIDTTLIVSQKIPFFLHRCGDTVYCSAPDPGCEVLWEYESVLSFYKTLHIESKELLTRIRKMEKEYSAMISAYRTNALKNNLVLIRVDEEKIKKILNND